VSIRSREELERALRGMGLRCRVEEHGALAVCVPEPGERGFENADTRQRAIALARSHGFSHLALELEGADQNTTRRAAVPRD